MITLDWTKNIKPWIDDNKYFYTYSIIINPSSYSNNDIGSIYEKGLIELLSYFNKKIPSNIKDLVKTDQPYLFDPRSNSCSYAFYLISIDKDLLDSLEDEPFDIPEGITPIKMSYMEFLDSVKSYDELLNRLKSYLDDNDKVLTNSGREVKINGSFLKFKDSIYDLMNDNGVLAKNLFLELYFTDSYFLALVIYDNQPMLIGKNKFSQDYRSREVLVNGFFSNKRFVDNFISSNVNKDEYYNWANLISSTKGIYDIKIENSTSVNTAIKNAIEDGPIANLLKDYKDQAMKDYQKALNPVKIEIGGPCGNIDEDYLSKIVKNIQDKGFEDSIIQNTEGKINILDYVSVDYKEERSVLGGYDFVGDRILSDFLDNHSYPRTIEEAYKNILNYISIEDLLKKALECIADVDVPKICIDVYNPFVFNFPDTFSIDGIFDSISDLIISQILFIVQEAIMALMRQILKIIEECEFEDLATLGQKQENLFVNGTLDQDSPIIQNLLNNFEDFQNTKDLLSNNFYDFAEEVYRTLLPTEFCSLINAVPTSKTMMLVNCILDLKFDLLKTKLDTDEKIISSFVALRSFFNSDICNIGKFVPSGEDEICQYTEIEYIKDNLVASMPNLTPQEVEDQLNLIRSLKQNKLDYFSSMLFGGNKDSVVFGSKSPEEFAQDQIPCAADNDNLKYMVGVTIDGIINPINTIFVDAAAGSFASSEFFADPQGRVNYKNKLTEVDFIKSNGAHSVSIGNLSLNQNKGTSKITLKTPGINLESDVPLVREFADDKYWREEEFKIFPYESIQSVSSANSSSPLQQPQQTQAQSSFNPSSANQFDLAGAAQAFSALQNVDLDFSRKKIEEDIIRKIGSVVSNSQLMQINTSITKDLLSSLVQDSLVSKIMFDCWDGNQVLRKSIIDKFVEEECKTRDASSLNKSLSTGLIDLYVRNVIIQIAYNNFILASDFGFNNLNKSFAGDLIIKNLDKVIKYLPESYIMDFDSLIERNMQFVTTKFKQALGNYANNNVDRINNIQMLFVESLPVISSLSESLIRTSLSKVFIVETELNGSKTRNMYINLLDTGSKITVGLIASVTLASGSLDETFNSLIVKSDKYKLMFDYCFPIKDYVSSYSIYNLYNLGLNSSSWGQISDLIVYSLDSIANSGKLTYDNDSMVTKERSKLSKSRKNDGRSDVVRYLSLPWIFRLLI